MKVLVCAAALMVAAPSVLASNFAECILDKLPGTANQPTHGAAFQQCTNEHPSGYFGVKKGSGRGVFGFSDGNACIVKKAKNTAYELSSMQIAFSCRCLYDKPSFAGEMCAHPANEFRR